MTRIQLSNINILFHPQLSTILILVMKTIPALIISFLLLSTLHSCTPSMPIPLELSFYINANNSSRTVISGHILGGNMGIWADMKDGVGDLNPPTPGHVSALSPLVFRFPGGNISNHYCWKKQRAWDEDDGKWKSYDWGTDVYEYMDFLDEINCVPLFSINPFDHTINSVDHSALDEATELVALFLTEGFSGGYYELGNENDGPWNPMISIPGYTARFIEFAEAMKEVDPTIHMMGPVISGYETDWVDRFLEELDAAGKLSLLDYFSFHHYGGWISDSNSEEIDLSGPQGIEEMMVYIRDKCSGLDAPEIKIALTEYNAANWDTGCDRGKFSIEQALWIADAVGMLFLYADMGNIWITLHHGSDPHTLVDSDTDPTAHTKNYWPYYCAVKALSGLTPDEEVEVLNKFLLMPTTVITSYGVKKSDGTVGLLFINKIKREISLEIELINMDTLSYATVYTLNQTGYEENNGPEKRINLVVDGVLNVNLPYISITAVVLE